MSSTDREADAEAWHSERVLEGEFEEIPSGSQVVQVDVPEHVEEFARERYDALRGRGREVTFSDLLIDHMEIEFEFVVQSPAPDDDEFVITDDEKQD